mgnify:CR=1 FL=1
MTKSAWDRVTEARKTNRLKSLDLVPLLFDDFIELETFDASSEVI